MAQYSYADINDLTTVATEIKKKLPYAVNNITGAHNLFNIDLTSATKNGVTVTKVDEHTLNLNGTVSEGADTGFNIASLMYFKDVPNLFGKQLKLSCQASVTDANAYFQINKYDGTNTTSRNINTAFKSTSFLLTSDCLNSSGSGIYMHIKSNNVGHQFDNITIQVMLTAANDYNQEFTDYTMTNRELTMEKLSIQYGTTDIGEGVYLPNNTLYAVIGS